MATATRPHRYLTADGQIDQIEVARTAWQMAREDFANRQRFGWLGSEAELFRKRLAEELSTAHKLQAQFPDEIVAVEREYHGFRWIEQTVRAA